MRFPDSNSFVAKVFVALDVKSPLRIIKRQSLRNLFWHEFFHVLSCFDSFVWKHNNIVVNYLLYVHLLVVHIVKDSNDATPCLWMDLEDAFEDFLLRHGIVIIHSIHRHNVCRRFWSGKESVLVTDLQCSQAECHRHDFSIGHCEYNCQGYSYPYGERLEAHDHQ